MCAKGSWPLSSVCTGGRGGSFKTSLCSFVDHSSCSFVYYNSTFNHEDGACFSTSDGKKKREGKLSLRTSSKAWIFFSLQLTLPIRNKNYASYACKPFTFVVCFGVFLEEFENFT